MSSLTSIFYTTAYNTQFHFKIIYTVDGVQKDAYKLQSRTLNQLMLQKSIESNKNYIYNNFHWLSFVCFNNRTHLNTHVGSNVTFTK